MKRLGDAERLKRDKSLRNMILHLCRHRQENICIVSRKNLPPLMFACFRWNERTNMAIAVDCCWL